MSGIDNPIAISAETSPPAPKWLQQKQQCSGNKDDIDSADDAKPQQRCNRATTATNNARAGEAAVQEDDDALAWPRSDPPRPSDDGAATARTLNMNGYASKKSLAQGMLDLALLAANAAQLKFVLSMGESHQFYTLLIVLIVASLCLQVRYMCVQTLLIVSLDSCSKYKNH